ncbi:hypothetical protein RIF29_13315 [Crotalaria pallida]|uniref:Protein SHORTAGE IN CHIASMATA 1 n=1 Tax=Crotalaria pallida TaxID=3830 RepID=A0AAN9IP88_CROPI
MRTRFLNKDYFTLPPSQPFLQLPVPRLHSPPSSTVHDFLRFDSPVPVSQNIDPFPIHAALSTFLSAVLPHLIPLQIPHLDTPATAVPSPKRNHKESKAVGVNGKNEIANGEIQFEFETPELDLLLEDACFTEMERMQMLCEIPEVENKLEIPTPKPSLQFPYEALESVSFLEDVISEYLKGENAHSFEDNASVQHLPHSIQSKFITFELDEESLGIPTNLSIDKFLDAYFGNIRPQNFDEQYQSITNGKEILGSMNYNMMKFFSADCLSKECLVLSDIIPEIDFEDILEIEHVDRNTALQGATQVDSALLRNLVTFDEFVFLEEDITQIFEGFYDTKALDYPETSEWMFKKECNFKNFEELIVSNEIALIDDAFKSLPVPVISDSKMMIPLHNIIGELFSKLKTRPLSTSDGIYLNWDLLEEDKCNINVSNFFQNMLTKIDMNNSDFRGESFDHGTLVFDLIFSDDTIGESDIKQSEELQKLLSDRMPLPDKQPVEFALGKTLEHESSEQEGREQILEINAERASLLYKSTSEISNLDYPLNTEKATVRGGCNFAVQSTNANVGVPKGTFRGHCNFAVDSINANINVLKVRSPELKVGPQSEQWQTVSHRVKLSENILALAGYFEKTYRAILQSDTELTKTHNSDADYFKLLSLQKHMLMECHVNGNNMAFIVLGAIKQAASYLCFYGLLPACLYVDKLCQNLDYLQSRLGFLQSMIKEEYRKVNSSITMAHPSLTVTKEILQININRDSFKVLIVAEKVFWWSLKNLLLSLGLSFSELNNSYSQQPHVNNTPEDRDAKMKELLTSDCLMVSFKDVSMLFPFNKFGIILEYGGPNGPSRIPKLSPNSVGLPHHHFLTVDLDDHATLKALCDGVESRPNTEMLLNLERLLNFCPVEQSYDIQPSNVVPLIPAVKADHGHHSMEPVSVIIVNTQNADKEMIMFRRSSYQIILSMEKGGIQVVERDLDLPVDIIISPAICLVWYDTRNLGKKATPVTEASSSLPLCIENIATDVLLLLSFYFRGCYLVFEGDFNFISTVMESSDGLYAAAASLGIDLQIFLCYSPELTDEVIVSCIKSATDLTRGLYPKMPESVTLGESFLTKFPGINPLTAHSILSSGITINKFLELSHEQRMRILEKYHVPEESISLFSIFCKYGEREDSKSIMTDSSSVSSGPDSNRCHLYQVENERKRKNPFSSHQRDESYFDELLEFETLPDSSTLPKPCDLGMLNDARKSSDLRKANLSMGGFLGQKDRAAVTTMRNPSIVSQPSGDPWNCKAPQLSEHLEQPCLSLKNRGLAQNDIMDNAMMSKNLNWHTCSNYEKLREDVRDEVVDFTDSPLLDKSFFISDSMYFQNLVNETDKDQKRRNKISRRLSFDTNSHPEPSSMKIWRSFKDTGKEIENCPESDFGKGAFPLDSKYHENNFEEALAQASMRSRNFQGVPFQEEMSHLSETPLSCARRSASPLKNSPFTAKFINSIKEKGMLRQKSLLCDKSAPGFGYPGHTSKVSKRRSPSEFEFFKYQPSKSTPGNIPEQKRLKQSATPSSNSVKKRRYLASLTPKDKISVKVCFTFYILVELKASAVD